VYEIWQLSVVALHRLDVQGLVGQVPSRCRTHSLPLSLTLYLSLCLFFSLCLALSLAHTHSLSRSHTHTLSLTLSLSHTHSLSRSLSPSQVEREGCGITLRPAGADKDKVRRERPNRSVSGRSFYYSCTAKSFLCPSSEKVDGVYRGIDFGKRDDLIDRRVAGAAGAAPNSRFRDPWFALQVAGFRRAPVLIKGIEKGGLIPYRCGGCGR